MRGIHIVDNMHSLLYVHYQALRFIHLDTARAHKLGDTSVLNQGTFIRRLDSNGIMGLSCSTNCCRNEEASDAKVLQRAVCDACEESLDEMVVEKTIATQQLEVGFELPDGTTRVICFTRRPLGLDFNRHMPITMKHVRPGSQAEILGVEQGWRIRTLHGYDVTQLAFQDVYRALRESSDHLP